MSDPNKSFRDPRQIRRLGTWDSRKPGQSPKEMKKLLEDADKTLKSTKMKPESQGRIMSSNKPESAKVRNPLTIHDRSTGGSRSSHVKYLTQKHYRTGTIGMQNVDYPTRTGVIGANLVRSQNPMLRKSATDAVKDTVSINRIPSFNRKRAIQKSKIRKKQIMNTSFSTRGKQRILEGGSRKTSVKARAGAGLGWLKRKYLSYGASQWRKSKTH